MFEGGPLETKGMPCHLVIEYCSLLIMDTFGHGLMGGFNENNGLGLCSCPLDPFWISTLDEISFTNHLALGMVFHGKP